MYAQQQNDHALSAASVYQQASTSGQNWSTNDWATSTFNYSYQPQGGSYLPTTSYYNHPNLAESSQNDSSSLSDKSIANLSSTKDLEASPKQNSHANNIPTYFTTQKIVNNTAKLSYTMYQLELLNAIYIDMKYPNSVQKTLIAKLIGITRDQVKIWFQNRRRKDTLVSQGKIPSSAVVPTKSGKRRRSSDDSDSYEVLEGTGSGEDQKQVVDNEVIQGVLYQLKIHQNAPSRLSSKRAKLNQEAEEITSTKVLKTNRIVLPVQPELVKPIVPVPKNAILTPVSSSSGSSTSSSGSSSSEEETVAYAAESTKPFNRLAQPFSIQDYIGSRYLAHYSKTATIHDPSQQIVTPEVTSYGSTTTTTAAADTKLNSWAFQSVYQGNYYKEVNGQFSDYDGKSMYGSQSYGFNTNASNAGGYFMGGPADLSYPQYGSNGYVYYNNCA